MKKKATAAVLALVMTVSLCACGGGDAGEERLSGTVYVPAYQTVDLDAAGISYIYDGGCSDGENLYFIGETELETEEVDPETGETYYSYDYSTDVYRLPLTGGAAEKLENFTPTERSDGDGVYAGLSCILPGADGTLWISEYVSEAVFDLPEDFDPDTDDKWSYQSDYTETAILRQVDATGAELQTVEMTDLAGKLGADYVGIPTIDAEGRIFVNAETALFALDGSANVLFKLDAGERESFYNTPVRLGDGNMGQLVDSYGVDSETGEQMWTGPVLKTVDLAAQAWGPEYSLPSNSYTILPGGGDYLFYYQSGDTLYGFDAETGEGVSLFSWIDSDIDLSDIQFFTVLDDGRVAALIRDDSVSNPNGGAGYSLAVLTAADASSLPEKTELTYATLGLSSTDRSRIIAFNRESDTYRITVKDYSEYNTGSDESAGMTRLLTEIGAGKLPDILDTDGLPVRQLAGMGALEDLWPFIESDPDLGREKVMEHVLEASEVDGKLVEIFSSFAIRTAAGPAELVGDRMSWTLQDLKDALARMPEGCSIFDDTYNKSTVLTTVLAMDLDSFVDWSTGTCSFDSDLFKALLEFCNSFPETTPYEDPNFDWDSYVYEPEIQRVAAGKQLLEDCYIGSLDALVNADATFGGDVSFVGFPREDGSVGSSFIASASLAMSSSCADKDGAWAYMRETLLPVGGDEAEQWWYGIPVNKEDFDAGVTWAATEEYVTDADGEPTTDENGEPVVQNKFTVYLGDEDGYLSIACVTPEQLEKFMDLYEAIDSMYDYDERIYDIVSDQCLAYFAGDRSVDDTADMIQSRASLYVGEQM